jgi:hypothetical protein
MLLNSPFLSPTSTDSASARGVAKVVSCISQTMEIMLFNSQPTFSKSLNSVAVMLSLCKIDRLQKQNVTAVILKEVCTSHPTRDIDCNKLAKPMVLGPLSSTQ